MMKKRKTSIKTLAARTAMTLALMLLTTATAWAAVGDVVDSGTCGDNLTWTLTENEDAAVTYNSNTFTALTLTITGTGAMADYASGSDTPWWNDKIGITRLVLPDGLTHVGSDAFYGLYFATSVTLPAAVTSIGNDAFKTVGSHASSCSFTAAEGSLLSSIGTDGFKGFGGNVDLRNCTSLTTIGEKVFEDYKTNKVYLPVSMRTVAKDAFYSTIYSNNKPKVYVRCQNSVLAVNGEYKTSTTSTVSTQITSYLDLKAKSSAAVSISQIRFDDIALTWDSDGKFFAIADEQDLIDLAEYVKGGDDHGCEGVTFKMTADLDFTDMPDNCHDNMNYGSGNFLPIGLDNGTLFKGHFDGDGHTITGLRFNSTITGVGLFNSFYSTSATVEGVTLVSPNFSGYSEVGGIVGFMRVGTVSNCAVVGGTITASNEMAGGIVGQSNYDANYDCTKAISGCTVVATTVSGSDRVGILVGSNTNLSAATAALTISGCKYHNPAGLDICGYGYKDRYTDGGGNQRVYQARLADGLTAATAAYSHGHDYYFTEGAAVTLGHGDRTGYDFGGYESSDVTISEGAFEMPASDVTVGATWTLHDYTITYDLAGGTADNVTTYNIESDAITLTNPTRTGYDFAGWTGTDLDDATETVTIDHGSTGDRSYTATWTASDNIALTANLADGNYWTTFYCGDADYTIATDGAYAYTATVGTSEVTLTKRGADIPKGAAVIIVGGGNGSDASVSISLSKTSGLAAYGGTNDLQGVDIRTKRTDIDASATFYVMGKTDAEGFGFYAYTAEYVPARKAYFTVPASSSPAPARGFTMVFGSDETGITATTLTDGTMADDAWYTMDGRRLQGKPATKGMYINGGKKIVIK